MQTVYIAREFGKIIAAARSRKELIDIYDTRGCKIIKMGLVSLKKTKAQKPAKPIQ